ncbi:type IV pilin N-terminal domain-containing protein [uncultured Methanofollis sp.]|uniref:type IV pilin N-terminal domain-containing protein n=1 Tax=uncultured Methanofollis sp. TaxID=262500 RepID=UPI0026227EBF|nr:type IV pilin N-terminal domain-containing protein [uncultured Methanofollis sp.]
MKQFAQEKNEEAVSPVIGVILMVAITVILAAVIAAFVFGMAGNMSSSKSVAATAAHTVDGDKQVISVTYQGGRDAGLVENVSVNVNDGKVKTTFPGNVSVGDSLKINSSVNTGNKNHVVVTASFTDGGSQVILDTYV